MTVREIACHCKGRQWGEEMGKGGERKEKEEKLVTWGTSLFYIFVAVLENTYDLHVHPMHRCFYLVNIWGAAWQLFNSAWSHIS